MTGLRTYFRFMNVFVRFLPIALTYVRDRNKYLLFGSSRKTNSNMRSDRGERIKSTMLALGPTFIKLGQVLSTRPDVLPSEYTEELSSLQDDVPPSNWVNVKTQIETELDGNIEDIFEDFNEDALSGASLAQVHTAKVDGERVAVKVRRPNVEKQVSRDIQVMQWIKPIIMYFVDDARSFSVETLVDEFSESLEEEMDYNRERSELKLVRQNFSDNDKVRIPRPLDQYSTEKVLTMEFVDGAKIDDMEQLGDIDVNRTKISERIQRSYFQMVIDDGVFHADPHPGNIAVQEDGTVVFYDFGMTGRIGSETRDQIVNLYISIATDQFEDALDILIDVGVLDPEANRELMLEGFKLAVRDARGEDIDQRRAEDLVQSMEEELYQFPFRIPPDFSLLLRTATIANGVCLKLDPSIDFIDIVSDLLKENGYVQNAAIRATKNQLSDLQSVLEKIIQSPGEVSQAIEKINNGQIEANVEVKQEEQRTRSEKKIIASVLMSGMAISASILYLSNPVLSMVPLVLFTLFGVVFVRI